MTGSWPASISQDTSSREGFVSKQEGCSFYVKDQTPVRLIDIQKILKRMRKKCHCGVKIQAIQKFKKIIIWVTRKPLGSSDGEGSVKNQFNYSA